MNALLFIIIVSVVIKYTVDPVKKMITWVIDLFRTEKAIRFGLPISFIIGLVSGILSDQGTIQALLDAFKIDYVLNGIFHYVDVFYTCMLLTGLSGGVMKVIEAIPDLIKRSLEATTKPKVLK